jgi:hypothetical protein
MTLVPKQPDAAGLIVRFAADPEHPYLLLAMSQAMLARMPVEVRPPGTFAITGVGGSEKVSSEHDSIGVMIGGQRGHMIKVWDARQRDFVGHWLRPS